MCGFWRMERPKGDHRFRVDQSPDLEQKLCADLLGPGRIRLAVDRSCCNRPGTFGEFVCLADDGRYGRHGHADLEFDRRRRMHGIGWLERLRTHKRLTVHRRTLRDYGLRADL